MQDTVPLAQHLVAAVTFTKTVEVLLKEIDNALYTGIKCVCSYLEKLVFAVSCHHEEHARAQTVYKDSILAKALCVQLTPIVQRLRGVL